MVGLRRNRALTHRHFSAVFRFFLVCDAFRYGNVLFVDVDAAFIRGCRRLNYRRGPLHRSLLDLEYKLPVNAQRRNGNCNDDDRPIVETDMPDRRSFLGFLSYGASVATTGDAAALGYDLETIEKARIYDDLPSLDQEKKSAPIIVTLPLEPASGGTFCVRFVVLPFEDVSRAPIFGGKSRNTEAFQLYRAIVDTGSPYLVLPTSDSDDDEKEVMPWDGTTLSSDPFRQMNMKCSSWLSKSAYAPTEEIYGSVKGQIGWKFARYEFRDPLLKVQSTCNPESQCTSIPSKYTSNAVGIVGVLDRALTNEATGGGIIESYALLGLIRNHNTNPQDRFPDPRPSFLEQEYISIGIENTAEIKDHRITSFTINGPRRELALSTRSLIPTSKPVLPLVDLRTYGDFVDHYAVMVESISFDGFSLSSQSLKQFCGHSFERPIVAVFDTGLTSCLLIRPFYDVLEQYLGAKGATVFGVKSVSLLLKEVDRKETRRRTSACKISGSIEADPRFYVKPIELDWFDDEQFSPYVIALGQTFLSQGALTIDLDERIAMFNLPSA